MRVDAREDDAGERTPPLVAEGSAARVRARYTKTGKVRFVSAIDLGRVWERSLRRADLPIAYSEGFSPHPRVSFPDALALGYASTGEYAELAFAGPVRVAEAVARLNAAFPAGVRIIGACGVPDGAPKISRWLRASLWELRYPAGAAAALAQAVAAAREAGHLPVERQRKGDAVQVDLRPALFEISSGADGIVRVVLHHVEPPVRPSEVHLALTAAGGAPLPDPHLVLRVGQGAPVHGGIAEALSGARLSVDGRAPSDPAGWSG